jgi:predicted permease
METLLQDLRYVLRRLGKAPMFTATAVVVLSLGIGANISVFTVLNGILIRPLPYTHPDRVFVMRGGGSRKFCCLSYANVVQLRMATDPKMQVGMTIRRSEASLSGPGGRSQVQHATVTAGLFSMLGVKPMLGRTFRDEENNPGQDRVAIIDEQVWRNLYRSDQNIIGRTLSIQDRIYVIVGVMPKSFSFPFGTGGRVWTPEPLGAATRIALSGEDAVTGLVFGRLPDGITKAQLTVSLDRAQVAITKGIPAGTLPSNIVLTNYQQSLNQDAREPLALLYVMVLLIWALSCLNVTSLTLARALGRSREMAVRAALGASRTRLLRLTLLESLLLGGLGSAMGLVLGQVSIKLMWSQITRTLPLTSEINVEWRVIVCLGAITGLTTLVIGGIPGLRITHRSFRADLQGHNLTASPGKNRLREVLTVAQLALTLVLLVGAGLFLRTVHALRQVPLGFTQQNILTGGITLNSSPLHGEAAVSSPVDVVRTAYLPLLQRIRAIPGVEIAALSSTMPLRTEFDAQMEVQIDGKQFPADQIPSASVRLASVGLAEAFGMPVIRGRFFTESDQSSTPRVAVINLAFENRYLSGQNPIGHNLTFGNGRSKNIRIVGVVGDMKQATITAGTDPEVYLCLQQTGPGKPLYGIAKAFMQVAIRGSIPGEMIRPQFEKTLHDVAPDATFSDVETIREAIDDSIGSQIVITRLLEGFAGLALLIATVGLYGLLSFIVAQRTREIGVRIAVGAQRSDVMIQVLRRAFLLVLAGLSLGSLLAWFAVKLAMGYIYGIQAHDGLTFTAVVVILAVVSLAAAWLPAHRAASTNPALVLRGE